MSYFNIHFISDVINYIIFHIFQVTATDKDKGNNSEIEYSVLSSNKIGINPKSGEMYIKAVLSSALSVTVSACDCPTLKSER